MRVKYFVMRRSELIVYIAFVIVGIYLTYSGSVIYSQALLSREPEIPKGVCLVGINQIDEIDSLWFSIQLPNSTNITEDAQARVDSIIFLNTSHVADLANKGVNVVDVSIVVPGVANNLRYKGSDLSFITESVTRLYHGSIDTTEFKFKWSFDYDPYGDPLPLMPIGVVTFDWRILMRESYDEYGMMIPIPPSQALWMDYDLHYIHEFCLMVTLGEGEALDLSKTFPPPHSYSRGYKHGLPQRSESYDDEIGLFPTYKWEFEKEERSSQFYDWLYQGELPFVRELTHVVFSLDDMRLEKEKIIFTSGIYFGLGTSSAFTGLYSLFQMLAHRGRTAFGNKEKFT